MTPKKYGKYSKDNLKAALNAIKSGTPTATAASTFGVPRTTLIGKISGKFPEECKSGVSSVLTKDEEKILTDWIINMAKMGFPVTKDQLLDSVSLLVKSLNKKHTFTNGRPGRHWYEGFLKRNTELSTRMAQNLTATRALVTENSIRGWFNEIEEYFLQSGTNITDPRRVFNGDESAFFLCPKGNSVLAKKGSKTVYNRIGADEKDCLTVMITGNASGEIAPPMVMFSYERIPKHIVQQIPDGWGIGKSENGWMTSEAFFEYISNVFYPWLVKKDIQFPVILYLDGHKSHITLPLSDFCREKSIILISLLPNSTHILQPLDVGLFRSLKMNWKLAISNWRTQHGKKFLKRENFAPVLKTALDNINNLKDIFANAFKTCGLFPFNVNNVNYTKVLNNDYAGPESDQDKKTENAEIIGHLRFLENHISIETLSHFYNLQGANWDGDDCDQNLYKTWLQIYRESELQFQMEERIVENLVIDVQEGLVLDEGWGALLTDEVDIPANELNNEAEIAIEETNQNTRRCIDILEDIRILPLDYIDEQGESSTTITAARTICINNENIPPEMIESTSQNSNGIINDNNENILPEMIEPTFQNPSAIINDNKENITPEMTESTSQNSNAIINSNKENIPPETIESTLENPNAIFNETTPPSRTEDNNGNELKKLIPVNIPTPFKKALFWPDENSVSKVRKRKKEKIPAVTTSDQWKAYYTKKEEEKKQQEELKESRKKQREENKIKRESEHLQKKRKKETIGEKQENKDKKKEVNKEAIQALQVGDYVIVNFEGTYFPGVVKKIKNKNQAFISTMTSSGINKWKWPQEVDEIWYDYDEIVEKIEVPLEVNNRGIFKVPEINKFWEYTI